MKEVYPDYKRGELEQIYSSLPILEKKVIDDFLAKCSTNAKENKIADIRRTIVQFRNITERNFDELDIQTLRAYLKLLNNSNREKWTKNGIKIYLKRFLKWKFKDWVNRFEELEDFKLENGINEKKLNSSKLIRQEEIETILRKEPDLRKKAFFLILYESGIRPIELRLLKWKDINFDVKTSSGPLTEINIYSTKTKKFRTVYVDKSSFYLEKLKEAKEPNINLVFPSREGEDKPISKNTAHLWINSLSVHIGRPIYPYLIRHSRASELRALLKKNKISVDVYEAFMGHSLKTGNLYDHNELEELKKSLSQIYLPNEMPDEKKHKLEIENESIKKELSEQRKEFQAFKEQMLSILPPIELNKKEIKNFDLR